MKWEWTSPFAGRTELYVAVCERVAGVLADGVRGAVDRAAHPREKTAAGIGAYLRLIRQNPEVYRFVVRRPLVDRPWPRTRWPISRRSSAIVLPP